MYSRFSGREEKPLRVPEHYSGCAFSKSPYPPPTKETQREEPSRHTPMPPPQFQPPPPTPPTPTPQPPEDLQPSLSNDRDRPLPAGIDSQKEHTALAKLLSPHGISLPLGMNFDELLLIGLILLLSHSEKDSDIVLWLALLLFCK